MSKHNKGNKRNKSNKEARKNIKLVKTTTKEEQRRKDFMRGYNYVKQKQTRENNNRIAFYALAITVFIMMAITVIAGIQEILYNHAKVTASNIRPIEVNFNGDIYLEAEKKKTEEPKHIAQESSKESTEVETEEPEPELSPAPTYNGTRYSSIDQFKDWELVELQKLAVAEGGFTENAMQACAFSAIQTARDKRATISQVIGSGKYSCVINDVITINGHEVTESEYSKAENAVKRAILEGPGEIGEKLNDLVQEMSLDVDQYYGYGPTYFYKEELLSSHQKQLRDCIKAKVYDEECGMYFYTYWDLPKNKV